MNPRIVALSRAMAVLVIVHLFTPELISAQEAIDYRLLATSRTSTMEKEMNEAAEAGFRVKALMGGETAFGGEEAIVVMYRQARDKEQGARYEYRLLATNKTSTMEKEIQEAGKRGFEYVGQTVFESRFGGEEVVVVLERDRESGTYSIQYMLLATSRTSTLEKELLEAGEQGFTLLGLTVGKTAFGGEEVVAILKKAGAL